MDTSTPMLVSRRPIFVYIDLRLGVAAITVPFYTECILNVICTLLEN